MDTCDVSVVGSRSNSLEVGQREGAGVPGDGLTKRVESVSLAALHHPPCIAGALGSYSAASMDIITDEQDPSGAVAQDTSDAQDISVAVAQGTSDEASSGHTMVDSGFMSDSEWRNWQIMMQARTSESIKKAFDSVSADLKESHDRCVIC